ALTVAELPANPKPSGDPTAASHSVLKKALEDLVTVDRGTYRAGDSIRIAVGAGHAGDWVSVWAYSPAKDIGKGWVQVPDDGILKLTLPSWVGNGNTTLSVQNAADQVLGWTTFKVVSK
ncbi:MAG TPA: hypothetical protein VGI08_12025, partial [Diaminobutyricibacter sp.]